MPKVSENRTEQKEAAKKASPYRRGDAPCTLFLRKKILYRKNADGTLDHGVQTISNKWWDGTLTCKSGTERPDIFIRPQLRNVVLYRLPVLLQSLGHHFLQSPEPVWRGRRPHLVVAWHLSFF